MDQAELMQTFGIELGKLCILTRLYLLKLKRKRRSCATRKLLKERRVRGYFASLIPEMRLNDTESFKNFHRMDPKSFDELISILGPHVRSEPNRFHEEITVNERLSLTLRYLASGDSMKSIGYYGFRVGASTTSNIIRETCALIWEKLQFVFPTPSDDMWKCIASDFDENWNFPNCLGAIDGKHVVVQAFQNHNALTFNYKHSHSLLLMAVADAHYRFIMVDIGSLGHNSDSGVFRTSTFGNYILHDPNVLKIPSARALPNFNEEAPFVFVADEAFPLRTNIMRPYPGRNVGNLPPEHNMFNQRLSKARRVVENTFGILANRFRIYRKPIIASKETARNIIKATVCLHNWLRDRASSGYFPQDLILEDVAESDSTHAGLLPLRPTRSNHASHAAVEVRNIFTRYLNQQNTL